MEPMGFDFGLGNGSYLTEASSEEMVMELFDVLENARLRRVSGVGRGPEAVALAAPELRRPSSPEAAGERSARAQGQGPRPRRAAAAAAKPPEVALRAGDERRSRRAASEDLVAAAASAAAARRRRRAPRRGITRAT